jgi:hypothetical protein
VGYLKGQLPVHSSEAAARLGVDLMSTTSAQGVLKILHVEQQRRQQQQQEAPDKQASSSPDTECQPEQLTQQQQRGQQRRPKLTQQRQQPQGVKAVQSQQDLGQVGAPPSAATVASGQLQPSSPALLLMDATTTVQLLSHLSALARSAPSSFMEEGALQELLPVVSVLVNLVGTQQHGRGLHLCAIARAGVGGSGGGKEHQDISSCCSSSSTLLLLLLNTLAFAVAVQRDRSWTVGGLVHAGLAGHILVKSHACISLFPHTSHVCVQ